MQEFQGPSNTLRSLHMKMPGAAVTALAQPGWAWAECST